MVRLPRGRCGARVSPSVAATVGRRGGCALRRPVRGSTTDHREFCAPAIRIDSRLRASCWLHLSASLIDCVAWTKRVASFSQREAVARGADGRGGLDAPVLAVVGVYAAFADREAIYGDAPPRKNKNLWR